MMIRLLIVITGLGGFLFPPVWIVTVFLVLYEVIRRATAKGIGETSQPPKRQVGDQSLRQAKDGFTYINKGPDDWWPPS